jgi:hypothetical protein
MPGLKGLFLFLLVVDGGSTLNRYRSLYAVLAANAVIASGQYSRSHWLS